jgi:hypothetical protein
MLRNELTFPELWVQLPLGVDVEGNSVKKASMELLELVLVSQRERVDV